MVSNTETMLQFVSSDPTSCAVVTVYCGITSRHRDGRLAIPPIKALKLWYIFSTWVGSFCHFSSFVSSFSSSFSVNCPYYVYNEQKVLPYNSCFINSSYYFGYFPYCYYSTYVRFWQAYRRAVDAFWWQLGFAIFHFSFCLLMNHWFPQARFFHLQNGTS